jgi:hypothetical protein
MKHRIGCRIALAVGFTLGLLGPQRIAGTAMAQSKGDPASGMLQFPVNFQTNKEESKAFTLMRKGEAPAAGAEAKKIMDDAAKWYAYRLTYLEHQQPKSGTKAMHELIKEAREQIIDLKKIQNPTPQQQAFAEDFGQAFTNRLREVANTDKPIARMNAAMLLADLARTGQEPAAEALAEVLRKPQESDAVKYWAVRGLHDIFALGADGSVDAFRDKEREARCIQALLDYLDAKCKLSRELPADEAQAIAILRRETVRALGQTRYPAFAKLVGKKHVLERTTALALTRVMAMDGFVPEPTLKERLVAAIALCNLQPKLCEPYYHADYPGYYTGRFVVDFVKRYNNEKGEKREPWKLDAAALIKALERIRTTLDGPPADKSFQYVRKITALSDTLLRDVVEGKLNPSPTDLNDWLDKNPPSSPSVYEGLSTAVVHGREVAAHQ